MIATATYTDPGLRHLRAPARDAVELAEVLADADVGGFAVTTLVDESAQNTRLAVEDFLSDRGIGDLLLIYLSCHGLLDRHRRLFFAASDTRMDRLGATGLEAAWILDQLEHCRARRQVLVLDSCFSGAFARGAKGGTDVSLRHRFAGHGRGRVVLTASNDTEYSFEGDPVTPAATTGSVFTTALVAGLRTGAADTDGDGFISVDDAYAYAFDQVKAAGAPQTPQRWLYGAEGQIVLARSPAGRVVTPQPLSEALRAALESPLPGVRVGAVRELGEWLTSGEPARELAANAQLQLIASNDVIQVAKAARDLLQAGRGLGDASTADDGAPRSAPQRAAGTISRPTSAGNSSRPSAAPQPARAHGDDETRDQQPSQPANTEGSAGDAENVLAVLFVARGPLLRDDLAAILDMPSEDVDEAMSRITAFVRGTTSLELNPESRVAAGRRLRPGGRQQALRRLLAWAARFADAGWPDDTPDYILTNYAAHLHGSGDNEALYALISPRWMDLRLARRLSQDGFARDVLLAIEAAALDQPPDWTQMLRGSLISVTLRSLIGGKLPSEAVELLIDLGLVSEASDYAALLVGSITRCDVNCKAATALLRDGRTTDAQTVAARALKAFQTARTFDGGPPMVGDRLAEVLSATGLTQQARTVAEKTLDAARSHELNIHVISDYRIAFDALSAAGMPNQIIEAVEAVEGSTVTEPPPLDGQVKKGILESAVRALGMCGRTDLGLQIAEKSENKHQRDEKIQELARGLIDGGQLDEAVRVAEKITYDESRDFELVRAVEALAQEGRAEQAVLVAEKITGRSYGGGAADYKGRALAHAAAAFARNGESDRAAAVADQALRATYGAVHLADLAVALAAAGHSSLSVTAFERAVSAASAADDDHKARTLTEVATRLLRAGQLEQAARAADAALASADTVNLRWRLGVLGDAAEVLASAGYADRAITAAQRAAAAAEAPVPDGKATAFAHAASVLSKTGQAVEASRMADRSLAELVGMHPGGIGTPVDLLQGCEVLAKAGYTDQALAAAQKWDAQTSWIDVTLQLISSLAIAGEAGKAQAMTESISGAENRARAQAKVARALFENGQRQEALEVINRLRALRRGLSETWRQIDIQLALARSAVSSGHLDPALEAIDKALGTLHRVGENPRERHHLVSIAGAYANVADALVKAGRADDAVVTAEQALAAARELPATRSDWDRMYAFRAACGALAGTGQVAQALVVVSEVGDAWVVAVSLGSIAGALAANHQEAQSATLARRAFDKASALTEDSERSLAFGHVARVLAQAGQARMAQTFADRIAEPWIKAEFLASIVDEAIDNGNLSEATEISVQILAITENIRDDAKKAQVLGTVAECLARAGRDDQAVTVAEQALATHNALPRLPRRRLRGAPLGIFGALALAGREDRALTLAENRGDEFETSSAIQHIANELRRSGKIDQSIAVAEKMPDDSFEKAATLGMAAEAFARAGQADQASFTAMRALEASRAAGRESFFRMLTNLLPGLPHIAPYVSPETIIEKISKTEEWLSGGS